MILRVYRDVARELVSGEGVLWAQVPAGREKFYANPDFVSAYADIDGDSLAALRAGTYVEKYQTTGQYPYKPGQTDDEILMGLMPDLQKLWKEWQDEITAANPWAYYGTSWDGMAWAIGRVA